MAIDDTWQLNPKPSESRSGRLGVLLSSALFACAPDLQLPASARLEERPLVVTEPRGDGTYFTRINASSRQAWVHFSLSTGAEVTSDPTLAVAIGDAGAGGVNDAGIASSASAGLNEALDAATVDAAPMAGPATVKLLAGRDWHLAFQRFHILTNGGVSGEGAVAVATLPEQRFEALSLAPQSGYVTDAPDSDDTDSVQDSAFSATDQQDGWYAYDSADNTLAPRNSTYVVRIEQHFYKLRLEGYYDEAGSSGHLSFLWAELPSL